MSETTRPPASPRRIRLFRRRPWANAATALVAAGVFMLMQPFSLELYGWSFATTLAGTLLFTVVSKFPD